VPGEPGAAAGDAVDRGAVGLEVALGSDPPPAEAPLAVGAGAAVPDGSPPWLGVSANGAPPLGGDGDGLDGDVTVTDPMVSVGCGPLAVDASNVMDHDPAGSCVVAVQTPSTGVPAVNESPTALVPNAAVTAVAGLPAVDT
jgi:hypothetical protein